MVSNGIFVQTPFPEFAQVIFQPRVRRFGEDWGTSAALLCEVFQYIIVKKYTMNEATNSHVYTSVNWISN